MLPHFPKREKISKRLMDQSNEKTWIQRGTTR